MQSIPSVVSPASLALAHDVGLNALYPLAILAWKAHAMAKFPEEAVGLVLTDGTFIACTNQHPEPLDHFAFEKSLLVRFNGRIAGIVHSHTPGFKGDPTVEATHELSEADMSQQIATDLPWGVSVASKDSCSNPVWWGDMLPIRPLIGRTFVHGITDCYSLVRDWHRLRGIHFDDVPRDPDWWEQPDKDLYTELFESRGFERVQRVAPKVGDCFICGVRSDKRNHAGVFVSPQLFLHHPGHQLSLRGQASIWRSKLDFLVRHKDLPEDIEC